MSLQHSDEHRGVRRSPQPREHAERAVRRRWSGSRRAIRINKAADDAAGLAISEKLESQVGGLEQAQRNAQDAVSLVQTAEGAMSEVQSMLQRVRDLAVQYNNGTLSPSDKAAITAEVAQLCAEISRDRQPDAVQRDRPADRRGDRSPSRSVPNDGETISVSAHRSCSAPARATQVDSAIFNFSGSTVTLPSIDAAIRTCPTARRTFGAVQNRLDHTLNNLATYEENLSASESSIKDVDMASEMVNFTQAPGAAAGRYGDARPGERSSRRASSSCSAKHHQ